MPCSAPGGGKSWEGMNRAVRLQRDPKIEIGGLDTLGRLICLAYCPGPGPMDRLAVRSK